MKQESALAFRLRTSAIEGKAALAARLLDEAGDGFNEVDADILAAAFTAEERGRVSLPGTPTGCYLRARWAEDPAEARAGWEEFFRRHAGRAPDHLLEYARILARNGDFPAAARQIERALSQPVPYAFFPRAQKLIGTLAKNMEAPLRRVRAAVLGTSTTALLVPVLQAFCLRDRIAAEFYQGLYGAVEQEVIDSASGLSGFGPQVVFLMTHWRDLALEAIAGDEDAFVAGIVEQKKALWRQLSGRFGCHVVQHGYDFPAEEALGYLAGSLRGGRTRLIERLNLRLREEAPANVSVLDTAAVVRQTGLARWEDAFLWHNFKQHPSSEALPALAETQAAHLRAVVGLTRKVLAVDLDNTLWKGVVGEDGVNGIEVGPGTAAGEAHQDLQRYLLDLKRRGVLLAACSKNNPEDARLPFEKHPHMLLRLEDFAAFSANWNDKAANLREIASRLSLGLDSFVFLDDNPLEREWVRTQLPQVAVVETGSSVFQFRRALDRGRYFFSLSLSEEDLSRAEQYRSEAVRETLRTSASSLEEFLAQLQLQASAVPISSSNLARVTQLINKTNQFNLTTRRYTESEAARKISIEGAWGGAFHLADRMGSYGLIGVLLCLPEAAGDEWEVDTWLMSCRTLGRQMEYFMFDRMMEAARARGVRRIRGVYRKTGKNGLVAGLYDKLGFRRVAEGPEEIRYEREVPAEAFCLAPYIRNVKE